MKKRPNKYELLFLVFSVLMSCTRDNVIDLVPHTYINDETAFDTPKRVHLAVIGVYNAAQLGDYDGDVRGYPFGAAYFEQNDMRGEDMVATNMFYRYTYTSSYNPSGSLNNINYWGSSYQLINRANLVIDGVEKAISKGIVPKQTGDSYIGEALFFRALTHLELLKHFSRPYHHASSGSDMGVPYHTAPSYDIASAQESMKIGRGTVSETYNKILEDLDKAEAVLYSRNDEKERPGSERISRVTKEAAIALKTRVYLNMRNWEKVVVEANKLNGLSLCPDPNEIFANNFRNSESIFSLANSSSQNPGQNGALVAAHIGRRLIAISPVIWNDPAWLTDDKRRGESMVETKKGAKYTLKYKDLKTRTDASPIIRYAEVILNRAEALARMDNDEYLQDLNKVRDRSLIHPEKDRYRSERFKNKKERIEAILKERRIEFLAEGLRWGDIHRLNVDDIAPSDGIPEKYRNAAPGEGDYAIGKGYQFKPSDLKAIPSADRRFLWPIPARELNTNPLLRGQQNPGW